MRPLSHYLTNTNITLAILVVMLTQNVFLEGDTISPVKIALMALMPFVFVLRSPYISEALIWAILYILTIVFSGMVHPESFRFSTIGYLGMFVFTFVTIYNLVHRGALTLGSFIKFLKWMIIAYAFCLVCQQLLMLVGIRFMPLVNLNNQFFLAIDKLPSWNIEPSHAARILGVLMYGYMECISFRDGRSFGFRQLWRREHKWVTIAFFWSMMTMGSGTAFIVLGVLSLYFITWWNAMIIVPFLAGLVTVGSTMGIEQFDRATSVAGAAITLDSKIVTQTDHSASYRILPILNTIHNLDLTQKEHWFGYGIDAGHNNMSERMIAEITDYGFLAYFLGLCLVFSCAIRFWSLPTLMFFIGVGGGTANIAYQWGILMVFMCVRYFYYNRNKTTL